MRHVCRLVLVVGAVLLLVARPGVEVFGIGIATPQTIDQTTRFQLASMLEGGAFVVVDVV